MKTKKIKKMKKTKKIRVNGRGPGRPKGSKNKVKVESVIKRGPGRPKALRKLSTECKNYQTPKSFKFLGYCNKCRTMVSSNDLESKFIWKCPCCGKKARTSQLKIDNKKMPIEFMSQHQYLNETNIKVGDDASVYVPCIDMSGLKPLDI